jgi:hypothetical protein
MPDNLPEWYEPVLKRLISLFALEQWSIHTHPDSDKSRPEGHESADGLACVSSSYFRAHLYFDRDLKQDRYGFEVLCHEILHLVTQPMADAAKDIAGFLLNEDDAERLMDMWTRAEEQTISRIARGLAREFAWEEFIPEHLRLKEQYSDGED